MGVLQDVGVFKSRSQYIYLQPKNILMIMMSKYYFAVLFAEVLNILADESDLFAEFAKEFEWD